MKIKFLQTPKGRPEYKKGETHDFNGPVEEGYARKYIERGWAEAEVRIKAQAFAQTAGQSRSSPT